MTKRDTTRPKTEPAPDRPTLRERGAALTAGLADVKRRATIATKVGRIAFQPTAPEPEPVDRLALINYATWLAHERRLLCHELYPQAGPGADRFIAANVAADAFHFPIEGRWQDVPQPSTRAVQTLDRLGIDWRADAADRDDHDPPQARPENGANPDRPVPHGWPRTDAALLTALSDLQRLDALLAGIHAPEDRDYDELPEYRALDEARAEAIDTLANTRAQSLPGLQAKARAILADGFQGDDENPLFIARGLARDLIGAGQNAIEPRPDPIFDAIDESRRLYAAWVATNDLPEIPGTVERPPEADAAHGAFAEHSRDALLRTVPATARGCAALARYAADFSAANDFEIDEDERGTAHLRVLDLIARSPLL